jgi:hypothetical protein
MDMLRGLLHEIWKEHRMHLKKSHPPQRQRVMTWLDKTLKRISGVPLAIGQSTTIILKVLGGTVLLLGWV